MKPPSPMLFRYTRSAMLLHWTMALGILCMVVIGLVMTQLPLSPMLQFKLYQLHKSIGITVLFAAILRLLWRLGHRPPQPPDSLTPIEHLAAEGMHRLLYVFMFAMPLTGWAVVSVSPFNIPTVLFGLIPWPHMPILSTLHDKPTADAILSKVHAYGGWTLIVLLTVHAGAALRHHLVLRDEVLERMLPAWLLRTRVPRQQEHS
jgi:cytochrome b561